MGINEDYFGATGMIFRKTPLSGSYSDLNPAAVAGTYKNGDLTIVINENGTFERSGGSSNIKGDVTVSGIELRLKVKKIDDADVVNFTELSVINSGKLYYGLQIFTKH